MTVVLMIFMARENSSHLHSVCTDGEEGYRGGTLCSLFFSATTLSLKFHFSSQTGHFAEQYLNVVRRLNSHRNLLSVLCVEV